MAYGLGKNSPITLSLGKESYEAMIDRHGQYVRWRIAKKCPCVTASGQTDIRCKRCGGSGDLYEYQKNYTTSLRLQVVNNIIELPEEYAACKVEKIYCYAGIEYEFLQENRFIQIINPARKLTRGECVDVIFSGAIVSFLESAELVRVCKAYYNIPSLKAAQSKLAGVYYTPPCDLVRIGSLKDDSGANVKIIDYRKNGVQIESNEDYHTLYASGIEYINPPKFIILGQNLNKETLELMQKHNGDAVCTFPYMYDVSENDIITVLSGTMTNKVLLTRMRDDKDDVIPEFFVESVSTIETKAWVYKEGNEFILAGTNRIHWIGKPQPQKGEIMSITYRYNPTYRVAKNIPMLRTSEDQRIPRKVILKLFSSFQESRGVASNA